MNHYERLGVGRKASQDEIRQAFRRLAKKYHPDVSQEPDAEEKFREVYASYEILSDPSKRGLYDTVLARGFRQPQTYTTRPVYSRYEQDRRAAYGHARQYSHMRYERMEEEAMNPVSFHWVQLQGVFVNVLMIASGLGFLWLATRFFFVWDFNGHLVAGYLFTFLGAGIIHSAMQSVFVLYYIWKDWFKNKG